MFDKIFKFLFGFILIFLIYFFAKLIIKLTHLSFPPAILGLILFTLGLKMKIIKESWIEFTSKILLENIGMLFVPFIVGLIAYKDLLLKNWLAILVVVFATTTFLIVLLGLFVEYGLKFLRLYKIRKVKND